MKLAIVVLCGGVDVEGKGYDDLIQSVRDTWAKDCPSNVSVYYNYGLISDYHNNPPLGTTILDGDRIICGIEETYENMTSKVIRSFDFIHKNLDYDYIFRCCCGSYIHIENMLKFLANKPKHNFYCGVSTNYGDFKFASGSGFFMSKDLTKIISDNVDDIINNVVGLDDSTIGKYFKMKNITIYKGATRTDIGDLPNTRDNILNMKALIPNEYHYHMRHNLRGMHHIHDIKRRDD